MYIPTNKKQESTMIGKGRVSINPFIGSPQDFKEKPCRFCRELFKPVATSHLYCCQNCADSGWSEGYIQRTYGMGFCEWVEAYEKSEGRCQICGSRGFKLNQNSLLSLVVDHCHTSGRVRGLLCHNCNKALGLFGDSIESLLAAVSYLQSSETIPKGSTLKRVEAVGPRKGW